MFCNNLGFLTTITLKTVKDNKILKRKLTIDFYITFFISMSLSMGKITSYSNKNEIKTPEFSLDHFQEFKKQFSIWNH